MKKFFASTHEGAMGPPLRRPPTANNGSGSSSASPKNADPVQVVQEKLKKANAQAARVSGATLWALAKTLAVPEELRERYLNPEFAATLTAIIELEQVQQELNEGGNLLMRSRSLSVRSPDASRNNNSNGNGNGNGSREILDIDFVTGEIEKQQMQSRYVLNKYVTCKLIIAEMSNTDIDNKTIRRFLSPVMTSLDLSPQFGTMHTAMVIGPWYLEWNSSSLCIPRKLYSEAAAIVADLTLPGLEAELDIDEAVFKASKVIIDWNTNKTYDKSTNNSQTFVEALMSALGLPEIGSWMGPIADFTKRVRTVGACEMVFNVPNEIRAQFGITEAKKTFESHKDLDAFVEKLLSKNPQFQNHFKPEWALLKSFDRAFWMRQLKYPDNPKFKSTDCPCKDPQQTMASASAWF